MGIIVFIIIVVIFVLIITPSKKYSNNSKKQLKSDSSFAYINPNALIKLDESFRKPLVEDQTYLVDDLNVHYSKTDITAETKDFVVFDFETANKNRFSACAIGLAFVENLQVVKSTFYYISPPHDEFFLQRFVDLHNINWDTVYDKPFFNEHWKHLSNVFENNLMIAYNLPFDIDVLKQALNFYGVPMPLVKCNCALEYSRKYIKGLYNYKLSTVARHFNIPLEHHQAESDAIAAAEIVIQIIKMMQQSEQERIDKQKIIKKVLPANEQLVQEMKQTFSDYPTKDDPNYIKFLENLKKSIRRARLAHEQNPNDESIKIRLENHLAKYKIVTGVDYISIKPKN